MPALFLPFIAPAHLGTRAWLLRLRWFAVVGQLITVSLAGLVADNLPWLPLLGLIALTAVTNLAYGRHLMHADGAGDAGSVPLSSTGGPDHVATSLMTIDLVTLTAMLYFSGGIDNPFSLFYFVNLAVAGVILRPRWAWMLTAMAVLGYGLLMIDSRPIEGLIETRERPDFSLHAVGLFFAFTACASVITHFVTRTTAELTRSERQLRETQAEHQRGMRLEGLTTLAAGAAHELATPLSTIDVISRELGRHLEDCETPPSVREDLRLIDQQLEICRQILRRMRSAVGDSMADAWDRTTIGDLIDCALEGVRDPDRVDVNDGPESVENHPLWIPQEAVAQAIRNLIHNGLDASGPEGRVMLQAAVNGSRVEFRIRDSGRGMSREELGRVGEPFYTTKEPGRGMGLGLYLTRNVVTRLGGDLGVTSVPGRGTEATVSLPCGKGAPPTA